MTFKGMTDEMLVWQTERFLDLEESRTDWEVTLRFARVLRYRDDKSADEADTIQTVLALSPRT